MRRVGRYILNGLTVLSLLLCAATVALWIHSLTHDDSIEWSDRDSKSALYAHDNALNYRRDGWPDLETPDYDHAFVGFHASYRTEPRFDLDTAVLYHTQCRRLRVPFWPIVLLTAIAPAHSAVMRVRCHRRDRLQRRLQVTGDARPCPACGYDLRATPARCPECGLARSEEDGTADARG